MDTAQWPQEIVVKPMEEIITNTNGSSKPNCVERKLVRPQKDQVVNCPRCNSTNTKFCYYNNYSFSQPRYFCKTCRRYWTEGGSLRNIPVGGGSRKNKKSSSPYNNNNHVIVNNNNPLKKLPNLVVPPPQQDIEEYPERHFGNRPDSTPQQHHHDQNPSKIIHEGSQDLNLGFSSDFKTITELIQVPNYDGSNKDMNNSPNISTLPPPPPLPPSSSSSASSMELINGITSRGLNNSFMTMPNSVYNSSGFSLMPSLNFSLDHGLGNNVHDSGYGNNNNNLQETNNTSGRFLFPFVGLKQVSNTNNNTSDGANEPLGDQSTNGYWNGMLGGGGGSSW